VTEPETLFVLSCFGLAGLGLAVAAGLKAWAEWLDVKRLELGRSGKTRGRGRSEVAALRERVRRLEAIASGVEP
jgi:hypothetical protein